MASDFDKRFGALVLEARTAAGMSRDEVCNWIGMHVTSLRRIESGAQPVRLNEAIAIDQVLDLGLASLTEKWGAQMSRPPEEIEVRGVTYRQASK